MNRLPKIAGVVVIALGVLNVGLWLIFARLLLPVRAGIKESTGVYKSIVAPESKRFLLSDGRVTGCKNV